MSPPRPYAGLSARWRAFALDYLLIALYLMVIAGLGLVVGSEAPLLWETAFGSPALAQASGFVLVTLPVSFYFALLESSRWQGSWGKRKLGLKVVGPGSTRLSAARALGRTALKFLPWELAHGYVWHLSLAPTAPSPLATLGLALVWLLVGANVLSLLLSAKRQTLYDRLAATYVLSSASPCRNSRPAPPAG